ncbi:MAG: hypothetical protein HC869_21055 [Rhodospirillales bacterium]|nr:hypothetical protein [Rhodospirillales bacterium]
MTERTGSAAYNDDAPNTSSKKVGPGFFSNRQLGPATAGSLVVEYG